MRFLIDNQLPLLLAAHLRTRGHDCIHVLDIHLDKASDAGVWARAIADGRVVISKDEDFVFMAIRPGETGRLVCESETAATGHYSTRSITRTTR